MAALRTLVALIAIATPAGMGTAHAAASDGSCHAWQGPDALGALERALLDEVSGIVASRAHEDVFWVHEDAGGANAIYAIDATGADVGGVVLDPAVADDWEDIALGPCGSLLDACSCLYIGDFGSGTGERSKGELWRVAEPDPGTTSSTDAVEEIRFAYPDGGHDAETLLVHPITGETLVLTKEDDRSDIYGFAHTPPQDTGDRQSLTWIGALDLDALDLDEAALTGGDVSPMGQRIVLRTDADLLLFDVPDGASLAETLISTTPNRLPTAPKGNGEAVAFHRSGDALYLVDEGAPALAWTIRCVDFEDTETLDDGEDPLVVCQTGGGDGGGDQGCGCSDGDDTGAWLLLPLLPLATWRRRRQDP